MLTQKLALWKNSTDISATSAPFGNSAPIHFNRFVCILHLCLCVITKSRYLSNNHLDLGVWLGETILCLLPLLINNSLEQNILLQRRIEYTRGATFKMLNTVLTVAQGKVIPRVWYRLPPLQVTLPFLLDAGSQLHVWLSTFFGPGDAPNSTCLGSVVQIAL